jgi:hypothetical protein
MAAKAEDGGGRRANRWRIARWGAAGALLLVPLIAMRFTDEVVWTPFDFAFMGALLAGVLGAYELLATRTRNMAYRAGVGVGAAATFLLIWVNGAVGIIGDENNDANLMYLGVLAVGLIGSVIARFQPFGMAWALFATALAQAVVAVIAVIGDLGATGPVWPGDIVMITGFFCTLWLLSAGLFRTAAGGANSHGQSAVA